MGHKSGVRKGGGQCARGRRRCRRCTTCTQSATTSAAWAVATTPPSPACPQTAIGALHPPLQAQRPHAVSLDNTAACGPVGAIVRSVLDMTRNGMISHRDITVRCQAVAVLPHGCRWYEYDDTQATPVQPSRIVSPAAYLLFYRRRHEATIDPGARPPPRLVQAGLLVVDQAIWQQPETHVDAHT